MILVTSTVDADYTVELVGHRFGVVDQSFSEFGESAPLTWSISHGELGPLGQRAIPVSAGMAWVLVAAVLLLAIGLIAVFAVRRKGST